MPLCLVGQFSPFTGGAQQTLFGAGIASFVGLFFSLIGASPILFGSCHGRSRHSQVAPLKGSRTTAQALFHPGQREDPSRARTGVSNAKLDEPVAVVLDLVHAVRPDRGSLGRRKARRDEYAISQN